MVEELLLLLDELSEELDEVSGNPVDSLELDELLELELELLEEELELCELVLLLTVDELELELLLELDELLELLD